MSIRPERARWFELLTSREDLTLALESLARTGTIELETHSTTHTRISLHDCQNRLEEYNRLARRYQPYWPPGEMRPDTMPGRPSEILDNALRQLLAWEKKALPLIRHLESLTSEQSELKLLASMLKRTDDETLDFALLAMAGPSIAARVFVLPPNIQIEQIPGTLLTRRISADSHDFLLAVGLPADLEAIAADLAVQKGRTIPLPPSLHGTRTTALQQVNDHFDALDSQLQRVQKQIDALTEPYNLAGVLGDINRLDWLVTHVTSLPVSENFAWITGWTSDLSGKRLQLALEKAQVNAMVAFPPPPRGAHAPLVMQNPWWAEPFELFARMLGTPAQNEADPSRLLAVLAPLLFGYMFGDVGHGLVLLITGVALQQRWPLLRILIANGIASIIFGFVFGSVFGREDMIPALWVHPIDYPLPVLLVPLGGGVVILLLGLLLNGMEFYWRRELRRWWQVEAAVLLMYVSIIASIFFFEALLTAGIGLAWYFVGSALQSSRNAWSSLIGATGNLIESLLQLLLNTVSFVRVGAFALAHSGLSLAFNIMAAAPESALAGILILLVGNLIVIMLEGLVVTIQTTRLILFEFFIRFLRGTGRMFRPLEAPTTEVDTRSKT